MKQPKFVTVATFDNSALAHIAKSKLDVEGIRSFLDGEHHVSMDWLISNAVGGIKLVVNDLDREAALQLLEQDNSDDLQNIELEDDDESEESIECPACNSTEVHDDRYHRKSIFLSILFLGFPFPFTSNVNRCMDCGLRWLPD